MSEKPNPDGVRLLPWSIPTWLIDVALIGLIVVGFIGRSFVATNGRVEITDWIELVVAVTLLLARRRYPLPALAGGAIAAMVFSAIGDDPTLLMPITLILLFTVAAAFDRRTALAAGVVTTAVFLLTVTAILGIDPLDGAVLAAFAWPAFAVTAGTAIRATRENVAAANDRARRAEESRELEAQRRVVEERLRIARDVHDLVAHHIAVVNVQSGVAAHLLDSDPAAASEALSATRTAAATVIDELGDLLSVLRAPDEPGGRTEPTEPTPDLTSVDELVTSFGSSGLAVLLTTSGSPRPLTRSAEVAAYRTVQEALTNAHKHGDGTASVTIDHNDAGLTITVTNPVGSKALADGSGLASESGSRLGLIGMRERVEAAGGTLHVRPPTREPVFRIDASFPRKDS